MPFLSNYDVFVDDFIGMAQGTLPQLVNDRRVLLHTLDEIFRALDPSRDGPYRKEHPGRAPIDDRVYRW